MRQKPEQLELALEARGEASQGQRSGEAPPTSVGDERSGGGHRLMEQVVERVNALAALKRAKQNQGRPGVDGMSVDDLTPYLVVHWKRIREQLLAGSYQPQPVRRQEIPKPDGGTRTLGIPTVLDRFIQQCLLQALQPEFDPTFSEHSYGFRPGRSAHDAVRTLKRLFARLRLQVNQAKSTVARVWERKFLGYSFWVAPGRVVRPRVAPAALAEMKARVRVITSRNGGRSMAMVGAELRSYLTGWKLYFRLAETPRIFRDLDEWLRHRLRAVQLKQWRHGTTVYRELRARGVPDRVSRAAAAHARRWWAMAAHGALQTALPTPYFDRLGVPRLGGR